MQAFFDSVAYFFAQAFWLDLGKLVLGTIMLVASFICLWIALCFARWHQQLIYLEALADNARSQIIFSFSATRARLAAFRVSLQGQAKKSPRPLAKELLRHALPVLLLLLAKEKSLLGWGLALAKIVLSVYREFLGKELEV